MFRGSSFRFIAHADGMSRGGVFTSVYPCICLFSARYLKIDASRIIKLDTEMFHDECWKAIYFVIKKSKVKVTSHKNIADVGLCTLVGAGFL